MNSKIINTFVKKQRIYIDVEMTNPIDAPSAVNAEFDVSFNQDILKHSNKFQITVARLLVPASVIELFRSDNITFSITLRYNNTDFQEFLSFPEIQVRTINELLRSMNNAFQASFEALKLANPAAPPDFAPFYTFDNSTKQLTLFVDENYNIVFAGAPTVEIWINQALLNLLNCQFLVSPVNIPEIADGRSGQFEIPDLGTNNRTTFQFPLDDVGVQNVAAAIPALSIAQAQGNCLSSISQLHSFIIFTDAFGNRPQIQNNVTLVDEPEFKSSNYVQKNVIFDLLVDNTGSALTENFVYTPSLYRWIDLLSSENLNRVQFCIFYRLNDGSLHPLKINIGRTLSIKFLLQSADPMINHDETGIDSNFQLDIP